MNIKSIVLAASTLVLSTSVNATLVGLNDSAYAFLGVSEDGFNITLDTSTGLEWLDWSLTTGRSYNDVFAQTAGGNLNGWRYANEADFTSLAQAAGIPTAYYDAAPGGTNAGFEILNTFLGSGSINNESLAISAELSLMPGSHILGGFISSQSIFLTASPTAAGQNGLNDEFSYERAGSALIRNTSVVPVPAAAWLFGSGLLGLVGVARRKVRA